MAQHAGQTRPWADPQVTAIHRMPAHSQWRAWETEEAAARDPLGRSGNVCSLDGDYWFRLYASPEETPAFYAPDYVPEGFVTMPVPANPELMGQGEPIYTNVPYPWPVDSQSGCLIRPHKGGKAVANPPYIPESNPTACYLRDFDLPAHFAGRALFLRFDGVETAYEVWLNGVYVGYAEDSKLPSEFDVTACARAGTNRLCVRVLKLASSSYLEDQDYWYLSGISRSVWLVSKPFQRIDDIRVTALPDEAGPGGVLTADVTVSRVEGFADHTVRVAVYDAAGARLAEDIVPVQAEPLYRTDALPAANTARACLRLERAVRWNPECPALYTVTMALLAPDGTVVDVEACRTGFKRVAVRDGVVILNGQRLLVHGVNRHEHSAAHGRAVTEAEMRQDICSMKRMHINAVRTCHYPDDPRWYELCDELGLLLTCESNIETHGVAGMLTNDPAWGPAFLERAIRMVQCYKNHVSIFAWSLGNESGTGPNHAAMYGYIKEYDPTRLCQYEAGNPGARISDVRGCMYATVQQILDMLSDPTDARPIILVEYLYQIRNSGGGMHRFVHLRDHHPRFQGGHVWDWMDKCLVAQTGERTFYGYGGDFGESFLEPENPLFMTNNGLVLPDGRWKPVAFEVQQAYAPVRVERPGPANGWETVPAWTRYIVKNRGMRGLEDYACTAILRENGEEIARREVALPPVAPGGQAEVCVDFAHAPQPGGIYHIDFVVRRTVATFFAEAGDEVSRAQFDLPGGVALPSGAAPTPAACAVRAPVCEREGEDFVVRGAGFLVAVSAQGRLTRYERHGAAYVLDGGGPCLNRPLTGLDAKPGWGWYDEYAKVRGLTARVGQGRVLCGEDAVALAFPFVMDGAHAVTGELGYEIMADGTVCCRMQVWLDAAYRAVPRVGFALTLPRGYDALRYFGRGPLENYADRTLASWVGVHESTVAAQHFPFIPPSENGGHEQTRSLTLTDADGHCLRVWSDAPFHFDVHDYTVEDCIAATHEHTLPRAQSCLLHIDCAHAPIGSDMAWSTAMDAHTAVAAGAYSLRFCLRGEELASSR